MFRTARRITTILVVALVAALCVVVALAKANAPGPVAASQPERPTPARPKGNLGVQATELWRVSLPVEVVGLPVSDDKGVVVTAGGSEVVAVSNEGTTMWTTAVAGALVKQPRLDGEFVYVAAKRAVVALRRATGEVAWSVATTPEGQADNRANRPVVVGDAVVVTTKNGNAFGLDSVTGAPRWSLQLPTGSLAEPAAVGGVAIVVGIGEWYGVDVGSGAVLWSGELGLFGTSSPVGYDDRGMPTAAVASDERVTAVDARTGHTLWQAVADQSELHQVPVVDRFHQLLVPDHWGRLTAFDAHTGDRRWITAGDDTIAEFGEPVSLGAEVVAMALDADGPRIASPVGVTTLDLPAQGHGVAAFGDAGVVISTWGGTQNWLVAVRVHIGT